MLLSVPFTKKDIREVVFSMQDLKSPGPDGVPSAFFRKFWSETQLKVCDAVRGFFNGDRMLAKTSNTFIALIPKVLRPDSVSNFRPIRLCKTLYKVISKCLMMRMKNIMRDIIKEFQNALCWEDY